MLHSEARRGRASAFFPLIPWVLSGAVFLQAAHAGVTGKRPCHAPPSNPSHSQAGSTRPVSDETSASAGPTVAELRAAFPGFALHQADAVAFNAFVLNHPGSGRLLTGPALAAVLQANPARVRSQPEPARTPCDTLPPLRAERCRDSLLLRVSPSYGPVAPASGAAGAPVGEPEPQAAEPDGTSLEDERAKGWFVDFFADVSDGGSWGGDDWAAVLYVVIGVVVVGAFVLYGVQALYELAANQDDAPLFVEAGLRVSYSGRTLSGSTPSSRLYRDAYLAGMRLAVGFDRPGLGLGLTAEGGYIDVHLRGVADPQRTFDFEGGYLVAGPLLRFGRNDPYSFNLEFLNGTSTHASIGWISKSRMTVQRRVGAHTLVGIHLGAVFYDLHFLDGLGWREGDFNRDLSLVYGLDAGWAF